MSRSSSAPSVAIIGAGFAGIGMAIRLQQAGFDDFTIFEKEHEAGGVWRDNTYPGAGCDVPSHLYSFSFDPSAAWTQRYAQQSEIHDYLRGCVERFDLGPHIRFGTELASAKYDDARARWILEAASGETFTATVLVTAVGQLNRPVTPDLAGIDDFEGTSFHSARWDHEHDLDGARVAVIGNGASAVQFVPEIASKVTSLTVFQRSANWIRPKPDAPYTALQRRVLGAVPPLRRGYRAALYLRAEARNRVFRGGLAGRNAERAITGYLHRQVDDPELRRKLTPDYPLGCKRILISNDYFPALTRDSVTVVDDAIERVAADGIVTADGTHHRADTIIYATGFDATHFLAPIDVVGRDGRRLNDAWSDGAEAHLGMTVPGFPNLFVLYGPNTNLGNNSIIFMLECQIRYVIRALRRMRRRSVAALEIRPEPMRRYNQWVQRTLRKTVWSAGCDSWYKTASGKITANWPSLTARYWLLTRLARFADFAHHRRPVEAVADVPDAESARPTQVSV